jgi:hypothetical protein
MPTGVRGMTDALVLAGLAIVLVSVTGVSLATKVTLWQPNSPESHWCLPDQRPTFVFGFAELSRRLGSIMGEPIECEHGELTSDNTFQKTTTGRASYDWCTNTPSFTSGDDHWMLTPDGVVYWSGSDGPPEPPPTVRTPDLRHPCPP